jgi:hypothetical protein
LEAISIRNLTGRAVVTGHAYHGSDVYKVVEICINRAYAWIVNIIIYLFITFVILALQMEASRG